MRIALTGSTGFIGKHLLPKLLALGHEVDTHLWNFKNKKYDVCIHLAAVTSISTEFNGKMFDTNIVMANEIMSMPCRIIYASSCSAAHLTNPYAYTKRYLEYLGERHGNTLGLRFHNVYGPSNNKGIVKFLMDQKDGARITIRGPETVRDYIHVDDVCNDILTEFQPRWKYEGWEVADIGTGMGTQTMDLVNLFMKLSGKTFDISIEEAGDNEPKSMVSNYALPGAMTLEQGLLKTIK